jgi:hypothetical protein
MHIHGRNRVLVGALFAAFALVVPSSALANHDLGIYKVEKQVTLESDEQAVDLSCASGDYALDGMWRIDHADQDDNDLYKTAIGRAVDVIEAYPTDGLVVNHHDTYHFLFEKNAIGRVQLKVFATCVKQRTEQTSGHSHALQVTNYTNTTAPGVDTFTTPVPPAATACPVQSFISTPGYKINYSTTDPAQYLGRLSTDKPLANVRQWTWQMDLSQDPAATVTWYWSCVNRKLPAAGTPSERHKLVYRYNGTQTDSIPSTSVNTVRQSCGSAYKAVVAGFTFNPGGPIADLNPDPSYPTVPQLWFLGMDPQPKSRDFKFLNGDPAGAHNVTTTAICLNYRTT